MYQGRDVEITNRIGEILLGILPADAERITANAEVGEDWSKVGFEFVDTSGNVGKFSFDDHPEDAAGDIGDELIDLREIMSEAGDDPWNRATFTVGRAGKFDLAFSYEDEDQP